MFTPHRVIIWKHRDKRWILLLSGVHFKNLLNAQQLSKHKVKSYSIAWKTCRDDFLDFPEVVQQKKRLVCGLVKSLVIGKIKMRSSPTQWCFKQSRSSLFNLSPAAHCVPSRFLTSPRKDCNHVWTQMPYKCCIRLLETTKATGAGDFKVLTPKSEFLNLW